MPMKTLLAAAFMAALVSGGSAQAGGPGGFARSFASSPAVQYDLAMNDAARISGVGLGLGTELDGELGRQWSLQGTALLSLLGAAASGVVDPEAAEGRDYLLGPGTGLLLSMRAVRREVGMLGLHLRRWRVAGVWTAPIGRFDATTHLTAEVGVMLSRRLVLGLQAPVTFQRSETAGERNVLGADGLRITLGVATDGGFGAARERR